MSKKSCTFAPHFAKSAAKVLQIFEKYKLFGEKTSNIFGFVADAAV
jgi:hypothetical protein